MFWLIRKVELSEPSMSPKQNDFILLNNMLYQAQETNQTLILIHLRSH